MSLRSLNWQTKDENDSWKAISLLKITDSLITEGNKGKFSKQKNNNITEFSRRMCRKQKHLQ